jgi:hypothetical protein
VPAHLQRLTKATITITAAITSTHRASFEIVSRTQLIICAFVFFCPCLQKKNVKLLAEEIAA